MYKNKASNGWNNICEERIKVYRRLMKEAPLQKGFSDMLLEEGLDIDKNSIQRIECEKRFVTDIELRVIAKVLHVSYGDLLD